MSAIRPSAALLADIARDRETGRSHAAVRIEEIQRALLDIQSDLRSKHSFGAPENYETIERALRELQRGRLRDDEAAHYSKCIRNLP